MSARAWMVVVVLALVGWWFSPLSPHTPLHVIPANDQVAAELHRIKPGDNVCINGWLVRIDGDEGWHWQSSLRRDDSGGGACELVYACSIIRE